MNFNKVVNKIKKDCKANNVQLKFVHSRHTTIESDKTNGYFDDSNLNKLKITVAIGQRTPEDWVTTLVHEYCHFIQLKTKNKAYRMNLKQNGEFPAVIYNEYTIFKKNIPYRKALEALKRVLLIELDCERKAIKFLKKERMNKKMIESYTREANSYLFCLIFDFHYRHFEQKNSFRNFQRSIIVDTMPDTLKPLGFYLKEFKNYLPFFESYLLKAKDKK